MFRSEDYKMYKNSFHWENRSFVVHFYNSLLLSTWKCLNTHHKPSIFSSYYKHSYNIDAPVQIFCRDARMRLALMCKCIYVEYKMAITAKQTFLLFGLVCPFIYGFDRPKRLPYLHVMRKGGKRKSCSMGGDELSSTSTTYTYTQSR